jgi:subtilisin family serine protease
VTVKQSLTATLALVIAAAAAPASSQDAAADLARASAAPQFVPGEVLVKFRPGTSSADKAVARGRAGATGAETLTTPLMKRLGTGDLELLRLPPGITVAAAMRGLEDHFAVEYAEPNWVYHHDAVSNDTYYTNGSLWGMYGDATSPKNQYGSRAGEAWASGHTDCSAVWVGIIDEGYYYDHEDLAANVGKNPGEIAGNGVDDDGNGYVDDVYGWDFASNDNSVFDGTSDDHGTHVAGTIGGAGGNGKGVAGVCWRVKLMDAKFLGRNGGTTANAVKAVDYFTDLKTHEGLNLVATSNSWGGGGYSKALEDAIGRANAADILFIAAAGNSTYDCDTNSSCYPAEYPNDNIIAVASITSTGAISSFSNYGATTIDIGAPGSGIWSTVPKSSKGKILSGYASYSGTSMATPHVTGAAALYAATHPGATAAQVKAAILSSGTPTSSLAGKTVTGDRLNVSGF